MRRLTAIAAILRTSTGLDGQEPTHLHGVRIEMRAVDGMGAEQEIVERQIIDFFCLGESPALCPSPGFGPNFAPYWAFI